MRRGLALGVAAFALSAAGQPEASVDIDLAGLRNARGMIHACMTRDPAHFPDCKSDPASVRVSTPAGSAHLHLEHLPPGRYAIAVFHDENSNRNLDKLLGVPKEGFAFSRNPAIRFRAPRFGEAAIDLPPGATRMRLKMHYLL